MTYSRPQLLLHGVAAVANPTDGFLDGAVKAAKAVVKDPKSIRGVIVATFSNPQRFPPLAVQLVSQLGLDRSIPAFDLQLACSAYPTALYLADNLATDGGKILIVDGDLQTPLVDRSDIATGAIFSDAVTASVVSVGEGKSSFAFLNRADDALTCDSSGPIRMNGFKVFSFVATKVSKFLKEFLAQIPSPDFFVPHQANPYMIRQLARSLSLEEKLLTLDESRLNPGSCSIPFTLAENSSRIAPGAQLLVSGFGAGFAASAATLSLAEDFKGVAL